MHGERGLCGWTDQGKSMEMDVSNSMYQNEGGGEKWEDDCVRVRDE